MTDSESRLRYLDLSGYAFSGKHAMIDLMREFRSYTVAPFQYEFNLLRIQGGIRDLESALMDDWSPIRSDAAIRRFRRIVRRFATRNSWIRPSTWLEATGWNYDDFFKGQFSAASNKYIDALVDTTYRASWPFSAFDMATPELFIRKLLKLLRINSAFDIDYDLSAPDNFLELTREYMNSLMLAFAEPAAHTVVMHNSFEPFNPSRTIRYFYEARSIIVDRDPRDMYVAQNTYVPPGTIQRPGPYRGAAVPPEIFVRRFRLCRAKILNTDEDPRRVLRLRYEDLVLRYDDTLVLILSFLAESADSHVWRGSYFKPEISARNIGLWRNFYDQRAVEYIARELPEFCFEP